MTPVCEMKIKTNRLGFFTLIGFAAVVQSLICISTNFYMNAAYAQQQFVAELSGKNEVPPVTSTATGVAKFQLAADGQTLDYLISVTNINAMLS
jgi:hypothetical protein